MGDINLKLNLNLKINKKFALITAGLLSAFSMASFVSFIDAESAGGIVIEKETMTVGAVVFRMDDTNPADIYGGTWELIRGDASIRLGDGNGQNGLLSGNNTPVVPVPEHNHSATFSGNQLPNHSHLTYANGSDSDQHPYGGNYISGSSFHHGKSNHSGQSTQAVSAGRPSGSVSVSTEGVNGATLDVRGQYITINVWKRTS